MIDLTPLDVRNKRGDFKKGMRGYDPQEVDVFLELVAERLEALVRENIQLRDRTKTLQEQVDAQVGREKAVQDALVTAQELREDMREQSQREADHLMREAESEAKRMIAEAEAEVRSRFRGVERQMDQARASLQEMERRRQRFLQDFRALLERELDNVEVEESRTPLEERPIELDLGSRGRRSAGAAGEPSDASAPAEATSASAGATSSGTAPPSGTAPSGGTGSPGEVASSGEVTSSGEDAEGSSSVETGSSGAAVEAPSPSEGAPAEAGPSADTASAEAGSSADAAPEARSGSSHEAASAEATTGEAAVDVAELEPRAPEVDDLPSSLELELMAGAVGEGEGGTRPDVPDLETVLAEAGIDGGEPGEGAEPPPAEEISPPPADHDLEDRQPEDRLALFDKDDKKKKRR